MRFILQSIIVILMVLAVVIKKFYPPLALFFFMFLASQESPGISYSTRIFDIVLRPVVYIALAIATFYSLAKLIRESGDSEQAKRLLFLGILGFICALWMFISHFLSIPVNYDFFKEPMVSGGACAAVITLAYYRDKKAQLLFALYLFLQVFLGAFLIKFPVGPWGILCGYNYSLDAILPSSFVYGSRFAAQFANVIQLAYYAAIALPVSLFLVRMTKNIALRLIGIVWAAVSLWIQLVAITRGIISGIIFGFLLALLQGQKKIKNTFLLFSIVFIVFSSFLYMNLKIPAVVEPFLERWSPDYVATEHQSDSYRRIAQEVAFDNLFKKPLFGFGNIEKTRDTLLYVSHMAPLEFTLVFGFPVGICLSLLLLFGILGEFWNKKLPTPPGTVVPSSVNFIDSPHYRFMSTVFFWITFFLAMTNSMAGKALMWAVVALLATRWAERARG